MLHTIQPNPSYLYIKNSPRMVPIAPAPEKCTLDVKRCNSRSNTYIGAQAASIARRNARERNRVKQVNDGYSALRKRLPAAVVTALSGGSRRGSGKKLSKVDTLKMVVEYIRYLERIIEDNDAAFGVKKDTVMETRFEDEAVFERRNEVTYTNDVAQYEDKDILERKGVTETSKMYQYEDEGVFGGRNSPYSDAVPSPVGSESSGVYSAYSNSGCYQNTPFDNNQLISMEEDGLMDAMTWWQEK